MNNALDKVLTPILERLATELESYQSTGKFRVPYSIQFPRNASTGREYNGINILRLSVERRSSPVWATFNQWNELGWRIRKGASGAAIYSPPLYKSSEDENGQSIIDARPPRAYYVYNSDDVHLANQPDVSYVIDTTVNPSTSVEGYEAFFNNIPCTIIAGNPPSYRLRSDIIRIPARELFFDNHSYYSTLAHEYIHWTGHPTRLNRPMKSFNNDADLYAEEELVAEFGAALVCGYLGIPYEELRDDHLSYLNSWYSAVKNDTAVIRRSITAAVEAFTFIKSFQTVHEEVGQE